MIGAWATTPNRVTKGQDLGHSIPPHPMCFCPVERCMFALCNQPSVSQNPNGQTGLCNQTNNQPKGGYPLEVCTANPCHVFLDICGQSFVSPVPVNAVAYELACFCLRW